MFFIGKKTVANVLASLNQTLADLKEVEAQNEQDAARHAQTIIETQAAHEAAINEAASARAVHSKIADLIAPIQEMSLAELKGECA